MKQFTILSKILFDIVAKVCIMFSSNKIEGGKEMNFRKLTVAALALAMLAGCGSSSASGTTPAASGSADASADTSAPAAGDKSVTVAITADLNTMDYHVATDGTSFIMHSMCIGGLTQLDENAQPVPDLAESWDVSEDGKVYTFHLRDGLTWSNGTPLTAADFVYGWQRLVDPDLQSEYAFIEKAVGVKNASAVFAGELPAEELGVKALDDKTFEVTLDNPSGFMLGLTAFPSFFPLNKEFFEAEGDNFALSIDDMIFCGPYVMSGWKAGNEYTFTKNPNYWNAANCDAYADEVVFRFAPDTQSAALAYMQDHELDVVTLSGELVDQYADTEGYTNRLTGYAWRLEINLENESLANLNLRKALSLSIDRDSIAKDVLKDGSVAAEGFIPKEFAYGPDGKDYRETAGVVVDYDIETAQKFYADAVAELGGDPTITLLFEDSEASKAVAENIQYMWQSNLPGLTVNLDSKTKKERLNLMNELNFDIGLTRWGPDYADPQTYMDLYKSDTDGYNKSYFSDEYDAIMNKAETGEDAADAVARWNDMIEAEKIILDDVALIPVYQNGGAMLINPAIDGIEFHNAGVDSYRFITVAE